MEFLSAWRGRRVLVTGGTGFIGQHVVRLGTAAGVEVHNLSSRAGSSGSHSHRVDLNDAACVTAIVSQIKPEGVIHLAAAGVGYGADDLGALLRTNVIGLANVLSAAVASGIKPSLVLAGSGFEYSPQERPLSEADPIGPFSAYGVSKASATLCAQFYATRLPITLLRPFSVYGPGEQTPRLLPYLIECARRQQPIELTGCEQVRDYTHVSEVAEGFWRALVEPPQSQCLRVLNIGTGTAVTLKQFVLSITDALKGRNFMPELIFGAKPYRPGEPMTYVADVTRMRHALAWVPQTEITEGVMQAVDAML